MTNYLHRRVFCALAAILVASACSGRFEDPGLPAVPLIRMPEGTPEITVDAVAALGVREPLSVREITRLDIGESDAQFVDRYHLAVTRGGTIAALDIVTADLALFDADGNRIARSKEPAVEEPLGINTAADGLVVYGTDRMAILDARGRLMREVSPPHPLFTACGLPDGSFVGLEFETLTVVKLDPDGSNSQALTVVPRSMDLAIPFARNLYPREEIVVGGDVIYVTAAAEYEVAAFSLDGQGRWLLRVPWIRQSIPDSAISLVLGRTRRAGRAMGTSIDEEATDWPTEYPAIAGIDADAQGRLYVFPHVGDSKERASYPVDVYGPDGNLIANAKLPFQGWDASSSDYVYRAEARGGRMYVVKYRIELPASNGVA